MKKVVVSSSYTHYLLLSKQIILQADAVYVKDGPWFEVKKHRMFKPGTLLTEEEMLTYI